MKKNNYQSIEYYLNLPWTYTIETIKEDSETLYVVEVNELPGICTDGQTVAEAMQNIKEAMISAFKLYMKNNEEIPEPIDESQFKGNIAYRTTSRRHYIIARLAARKGISLSQAIDECIDSSMYGR